MARLLGHVPAVLQVLVVQLGGLQLAGQFARNGAHDGGEHVGDPLVGGLLERDALKAVGGTPRVEVGQESRRLVLADVHAGQTHELAVVVAGIDHLGLNDEALAGGIGGHV